MPRGTAIGVPSLPFVLSAAGSADGVDVPVVGSPEALSGEGAAVAGSSVGLRAHELRAGCCGLQVQAGRGMAMAVTVVVPAGVLQFDPAVHTAVAVALQGLEDQRLGVGQLPYVDDVLGVLPHGELRSGDGVAPACGGELPAVRALLVGDVAGVMPLGQITSSLVMPAELDSEAAEKDSATF